jgi:hypothetical protein
MSDADKPEDIPQEERETETEMTASEEVGLALRALKMRAFT